jgi:hypothetical protein
VVRGRRILAVEDLEVMDQVRYVRDEVALEVDGRSSEGPDRDGTGTHNSRDQMVQ